MASSPSGTASAAENASGSSPTARPGADAPAAGSSAVAASETLSGRFANDFREAILACRDDNWRRGFEILTRLAGEAGPKVVLPGLFYTYLGVAVARCEGRKHDGMELVRYGMKLQPKEPDNFGNLAMMYLALGRRSEAWRALQEGLRRAPEHRRLNTLLTDLGIRRPPPVRFLARSNPVNVVLGQVTWAWSEWKAKRDEERAEREELAP
jgi:hypothetical protein